MEWIDICAIDDLVADSGVAARVNTDQVAIFYIPSEGEQKVFAISNWDPVAKANVIARGLIGDQSGDVYVASPIYKERYSLKTGACLDAEEALKVWEAKLEGERVLLAEPA